MRLHAAGVTQINRGALDGTAVCRFRTLTMERPSTGLLLIGATIVSLIVLGLATYLYARW